MKCAFKQEQIFRSLLAIHYLCIFVLTKVDIDNQTYYHSYYNMHNYTWVPLSMIIFEEYVRLMIINILVESLVESKLFPSAVVSKKMIFTVSTISSKPSRKMGLLILISRMTWKVHNVGNDKRLYKSCRQILNTLLIALFPLNCFLFTWQIVIYIKRDWRWRYIRISAIDPLIVPSLYLKSYTMTNLSSATYFLRNQRNNTVLDLIDPSEVG